MTSEQHYSLTHPPEYDISHLTEVTKQSLALLKPWVIAKPSSDHSGQEVLIKEIPIKAAKYVEAIQMGVTAAYSGFTVTEEVLFLTTLDNDAIEDEQDLRQYLSGMMELSKQARENAHKAFEALRNVRKEVYETVHKINPEAVLPNDDKDYKPKTKGLPTFSKTDIETLAKFAEQISAFATWWDKMNIDTDPPYRKGEPLSQFLDHFKNVEVVKQWTALRSQYAAYVQMISELEDADPQFFSRSWITDGTSGSGQDKESTRTLSFPTSPASVSNPPRAVHPRSAQQNGAEDRASPPVVTPLTKGKKILGQDFAKYFKHQFPRIAQRLKIPDLYNKIKDKIVQVRTAHREKRNSRDSSMS